MELLMQITREYGLFVALVAYILWFFDKLLKDNRKDFSAARRENVEREARYVAVIDKLSDSFSDLAIEVQQIKSMIQRDHDDSKRKVVSR